MTLNLQKSLFCSMYFFPAALFFAPATLANSIYVGHSSSEQVSILGDRTINLAPVGQSLYGSVDVNDNWSVNADITRLNDDVSIDNLATLSFDVNSHSMGMSYFQDTWSVYYHYSSFDDEQVVLRSNPGTQLSSSTTKVKTHSVGGGYFWTFQETWQMSLTGALHLSDWTQTSQSDLPDPDRPPQSLLESGESTLLSVSANLSRYIPLTESMSLTPGIFISWNDAIDSSSEVVNRNGRNVSQIRNPDVRSQISSQVATGSESYGQFSVYLSIDLTENWVLDLDTSVDFGTDEDTQSWSINLGYLF